MHFRPDLTMGKRRLSGVAKQKTKGSRNDKRLRYIFNNLCRDLDDDEVSKIGAHNIKTLCSEC